METFRHIFLSDRLSRFGDLARLLQSATAAAFRKKSLSTGPSRRQRSRHREETRYIQTQHHTHSQVLSGERSYREGEMLFKTLRVLRYET